MTLADPRLTPVREAMLRGAARGVFALQLHAGEATEVRFKDIRLELGPRLVNPDGSKPPNTP